MRVLNLGCGHAKRDFPEASRASEIVGVDHSPASQADVIHDLDQVPYPLPSDSFDLILMQDVIEHLENIPAVMAEVHRVARHGALVRIRTPHFSSWYAYNDPTHRHALGVFAFDGFDAAKPNALYTTARFERVRRRILFPRLWRMTGAAALANRFPARWEQLFAFVIRAENLEFELRAVKEPPASP
jgi:SAM-dependent methyltransferase